MLTKALAKAQDSKSNVKLEAQPVDTLTTVELITQMKEADPTLSTKECGCAIKELLDSGEFEKVSYVVGTTGCGKEIKATVLKEVAVVKKK